MADLKEVGFCPVGFCPHTGWLMYFGKSSFALMAGRITTLDLPLDIQSHLFNHMICPVLMYITSVLIWWSSKILRSFKEFSSISVEWGWGRALSTAWYMARPASVQYNPKRMLVYWAAGSVCTCMHAWMKRGTQRTPQKSCLVCCTSSPTLFKIVHISPFSFFKRL